jgi:predicted dehydrogenase
MTFPIRGVKKMNRRTALKVVASSAAAPLIVSSRVLGAEAPSKRIVVGCIAVGGQGRSNLGLFLNQPDARVVAVCDVFKTRSDAAKKVVDKRYKNSDCKSCTDFREIIDDKDINAVAISTPDHWHVPMSLMALKTGKDVFCEKPTKTIAEGRALIEEVKKRKTVFQIGLEDRSVPHYHKMVEWLRNGEIGDLERVDVQLPKGFVFPKEEEAPVPDGLDYNLFVGPAPFMPYTKSITVQRRWRMNRNFASGSLVDWGSHQVDTAQLAVNAPEVCPIEIEGTGTIPENSATTVPVTFDVQYRYSNGVEVRVKSGGTGIRLTGSKGWVGNDSWRGQLKASDEKVLHRKYTPETSNHWQRPPGEHRNFLDCVKSRKPTTYTAETMHLLHTTLLMGDIAIRLGRKLKWDPKKEEFVGDAEANAMRSIKYRDWQKA